MQLAVLREIKAAGAGGLATWSVQKLAALTPLQMQASALIRRATFHSS